MKTEKFLAMTAICAATMLGQAALAADQGDSQKPGNAQKQQDKKTEKKGKPGDIYMFNPQPDPPGDKNGLKNPGTAKALNPQPEPPGKAKGLQNPGATHGFNPQPDPPGIGGKQAQQIKQ